MHDLESEYILSRFKEPKLLSENGENQVYIVLDTTSNRPYIQKVFPKDTNMDIYIQMQALAPKNIPKIHHIIEGESYNYVIEEYISGTRLDELIGNRSKIDTGQVIAWVLSLCDTLQQLHDANPSIIHRDIKPSNIIITDEGTPKLIDFNISRNYKSDGSTDTKALGTEYYAAPEQFGSAQTDNRTDIYAIGKLMITLLTGLQQPFKDAAYSLGILRPIIKKCCEYDPAKRYTTVKQLKRSLQMLKRKRTKRVAKITAFCVLLLMIAFIYRFLNLSDRHYPNAVETTNNGESLLDGTDVSAFKLYNISMVTDMDTHVFVEGVDGGRSNSIGDGSFWSTMLPSGTYNVMCRTAGYPDYEFQLKILDSKDNYSYEIYPEIGKVVDESRYKCTINTIPQGLDIYIDGEYLGQSPVVATPKDKNCILDVAYNDTFLFSNKIGLFVLPSAPNEVNLQFETNNYQYHQVGFYANLDVLNMETDANFAQEFNVYVDDLLAGRTCSRYLDLRLPPGVYNISCREEGYTDYDFVATIGNDVFDFWHWTTIMDKSSPRPFYFYPVVSDEPMGTYYTVTSTPLGADVYVDNEYYGVTPTQVRVVTSSNRIFVHKDGYERSGLLMAQVTQEPVNNTFTFTLSPSE